MSGLASFFRDHLQRKSRAERGDDNDSGSDQEQVRDNVNNADSTTDELDYCTSLEESELIENDDWAETSRNRRRIATASPFFGDPDLPEGHHDDPLELQDSSSPAAQGETWKEWRRTCRKSLTTYMERRILSTHSKRSSGDGGAEGEGDTGGDDADTTSVVNVYDTRHDVSYLSDLTSSTRRLVSCSGVVSRVVETRSAKRQSLKMTTRRKWSVDGPLIFGYSRVVSFEVTQWMLGEENELRQRAQHCMNEKPKTRMRVFLYDGWALSFDKVLKGKPARSSSDPPPALLLRMENIPAKCVFPYDDVDWADNDMVPYCVCIGDKSPSIKNETSSLRFDDGVRLIFQHCPEWSQYPSADLVSFRNRSGRGNERRRKINIPFVWQHCSAKCWHRRRCRGLTPSQLEGADHSSTGS
jgi:hypothetical protein